MNVYGIIEEIRVGKDKIAYAKVNELNTNESVVVKFCELTDDKLKVLDIGTLSVGTRFAVRCTKPCDKLYEAVLTTLKIYKEVKKNSKDLAIKLGNAINVADSLLDSPEGVVKYGATVVLPEIEKLYSKLSETHTSMDSYAIGARLGQCMNLCAKRQKTLEDTLEAAERMFDEICKYEQELLEG